MGKSRKKRFLAIVDAKPRQLFSVTEMASGDLTIALRGGVNYEQVDGDVPIVENRISVHVSPDSSGTTIMKTLLLANGRRHRSAIFTRPPKADLRQFIISMACSDLRSNLYDVVVPQRDEARIVSMDVPTHSTLVFHMFVGSKHQTFPHDPACNLSLDRFRKFTLAVYSNHMNIPAGSTNQALSIATTPLEINGVQTSARTTGLGVNSLTSADIPKVIWQSNNYVSEKKAQRNSLAMGFLRNVYSEKSLLYSPEPQRPDRSVFLGTPPTGPISWQVEPSN